MGFNAIMVSDADTRNINRKAKKESKIATVPHVNVEVVGGNKNNDMENVELIHLQRSLSSNTKGSHGEARLAEHRALAGELLEHLCCSRKPIARLTNANVDAKLGNLDVLHAVFFHCSFGRHFERSLFSSVSST